MQQSETSRVREIVIPHIEGLYGVDLGYGGDSICPNSINIDLPTPYTIVGRDPKHLAGDCRNLHWFANGVLDYVYSSHLLEDFDDLIGVMTEWLRVIKPGGLLILCLPDEQRYRAHCRANGTGRNMHHSHDTLNALIIISLIRDRVSVVSSQDVGPISFLLILKKEH
jgi:predicted SAM-dependent methyltransferase